MRPFAALLLVLASACTRPPATLGTECNLNSDCDAPLVCRLRRCRRQCVDSRDCGAGLRCLLLPEEGGACQLPAEASCALSSECPSELVCSFGTCTTECVEDRDCPNGATCQGDGATNACVEPVAELCIYDSDCPEPFVCGHDQLCRLECAENRDCQAPRICVSNLCQLP